MDDSRLPLFSSFDAYLAGFDCAINGPDEKNWDFLFFANKRNRNQWEYGKFEGAKFKLAMDHLKKGDG